MIKCLTCHRPVRTRTIAHVEKYGFVCAFCCPEHPDEEKR